MTRIGSKELKQIKRGIERVVAFSFFFCFFCSPTRTAKMGQAPNPNFFLRKTRKDDDECQTKQNKRPTLLPRNLKKQP